MQEPVVRALGVALSLSYAALIAWLAVSQPQSLAEVTGGLSASVGVYRVDPVAFEDGLRFFHQDQFVEARAAFNRADSASRDARTQFYIAYSHYREGWGRVSHDDAAYAEGLKALDRAIAAAPDGRVVVDDPGLQMHTADELRAELVAGQTNEWSDLNPMRVLRSRK
jgi:tetratricopeptide (TPR) repeat protein